MPLWSAFCGGSTAERAGTINAARLVNLFRATITEPGATKTAYLFGAPGRRRLGTVPASGGRGEFTAEGRTWTVVGDVVYELTFRPFTATKRGTLRDDGLPVSWATNGDGGQQLVLVGGGELKVLNLVTNVLSAAVVLPLTRAPGLVGYIDGYFVVNEQDSLLCWFSAIENGLLWDALDFFARSTASDRIVGQVCALNRIWVFGRETSEAYENVGDADNPFQPIKGSLFAIGCAGPWTISVGDTIRWVGQTRRGGAVVYRLTGYGGTRLSTHAIEARLGQATTLATAEALTYEDDGHVFYALTCPAIGDAGETWVVDESEQQDWHQRSAWNARLGREEAWRVRGHAYVDGVHVVGDRLSGAICALDLETYDDDGAILRAVRRAPYLSAENTPVTVDAFELGVETGVGLVSGQGSDPQAELLISIDAAKTWDSAGTAALGPMGAYDDRTEWLRLGQARLDRLVLEVVITDPVRRVLGPGAWLRVTPGRP